MILAVLLLGNSSTSEKKEENVGRLASGLSRGVGSDGKRIPKELVLCG